VLDAATPPAREAANAIGIAYALTGLLRALPAHVAMGRVAIPDDVAQAAGLDNHDPGRLRSGPELRRAVEAIARAAARHLAVARALRPLPATALPGLLPARIAGQTLKRLERARFDPFSRAGEGDPLQSWRLALAAMTGRF
jgi:phytoene/squalene synthetase